MLSRTAGLVQEPSYIELFFIGHAMSSVKIYDVVKVKKLHGPIDFQADEPVFAHPSLAMLQQLLRCTPTSRLRTRVHWERRYNHMASRVRAGRC